MIRYATVCYTLVHFVVAVLLLLLLRASFRFALRLALRRLNAFARLLLVMALLCFVSVCFVICFAPLCLVVCFFDFDLHIALLRFDSHVVAMHCCAVLCLALRCFCFCFALPTKTAQRPNSPTARRLPHRNGPTTERPNGPNVASIPLIKFKLGQPFLLIIAEHDTAESARKSAAERLPLFSLREQ